jgi:hypothetical protein
VPGPKRGKIRGEKMAVIVKMAAVIYKIKTVGIQYPDGLNYYQQPQENNQFIILFILQPLKFNFKPFKV